MTEWQDFLKKNKGKGYSMRELASRYCKAKLSAKIKTNIKEGRYSSRKQAIAVAYSQVHKKYPSCKSVLSRKRNTL